LTTRHLTAALLALGLTVALAPAHNQIVVNAGRGPITVYIPDSYDPGTPLPAILMLHGYTSSGASMEAWLQFLAVIDEKEFIYAHPNGTKDLLNNAFWNATNACCNLFGSPVNDSQYLSNLLDEIELNLSVDPLRVHMAGHSNGGFMSYRMACDHAGRIASIASIAGASWNNPNACAPSEPVHVLQIHGTQDPTISFNGGSINGMAYPSAHDSVEQWAGFASCVLAGVMLPTTFNYVNSITGFETSVTVYDTGCEPGGSGELWTVQGAQHSPTYNGFFTPDMVDWLLAHPKTPAPASYCTAGTSASGCTALLTSTGTPSTTQASGFVVATSQLEGSKDGLFFYGFNGAQANSWGNGTSFQCVTPPVLRAVLLSGNGTPGGCDGSFAQDFNAFWSSAPAGKVPAPGSKVWMQLWYRDPLNTSNQTTSLSDALEITVGM
jgi:polyhydroxybutyrate depolymerase